LIFHTIGPTDLIHPSPAPHSKTSLRAYSNDFLLPQLHIYVTEYMGWKGRTARSLLPKNKKKKKKAISFTNCHQKYEHGI